MIEIGLRIASDPGNKNVVLNHSTNIHSITDQYSCSHKNTFRPVRSIGLGDEVMSDRFRAFFAAELMTAFDAVDGVPHPALLSW